MTRTIRTRTLAAGALLAFGAAPAARATDGHFLHGVGAINSAMGGAGVAAPVSLLGAFYVNPAGLVAFEGVQVELGFELFKPERSLASSLGPNGSGSTASSSEFVPIPAFGWNRTYYGNRLAVGVAGLGIGGFGVDYHVDRANPILGPRPYGFGQIYSSFSLMKIIPAVAYAPSPSLRLGAALNVDWASLAVDPMPIASPAVDPGPDGQPNTADDRAFYSSATDGDGAFGAGFQLGLQYSPASWLSLGAAYTSPQWFQDFEYGAVWENPNLPSFNLPRTIRFAMDVPAIYAAGAALAIEDLASLNVDAKYITYERTNGFRESGFAADGSVKGFGWRNIWSLAVGTHFMPNDHLDLRLGYNYSGNPIPDRLSAFNAPAPAVVQHHATMGLGWVFQNGFGVDVGYYRAFENSISGPFQSPAGPMPGTSVTNRMSEDSFLIGFTYAPARDRR